MKLRCLFGHQYVEEMRRCTKKYAIEISKEFPTGRYTRFLYRCSHCGKRKVITLDGNWSEDSPDKLEEVRDSD